ncbi:MAG: hypothetical protein WAV50_01155 [Minisyncoccia bacterium]
MSLVVPAVLPSSRADLEEKLERFALIPHVSRVQIDVVDGTFASPASWPFSARAAKGEPTELEVMVRDGKMLSHLHRIAYEIDLMCLDAAQEAGKWVALGASRLTFHVESFIDLPRFLTEFRARFGCGLISCDLISIGLAINIETDLSLIEPYLDQVDYVQFMGIARIGRQGQAFDRRVLEKMRVFGMRNPNVITQVDGGVSLEAAKELIALGVSNLVVGSGILRAEDPAALVAQFEALRTPSFKG